MTSLAPCPACARHVRRSERACPFCASALSLAPETTRRLPTERLGRAATFAFGAAVVSSATLVGCGGATPLYGAPAPDTGAADAGTTTDAAVTEDAFVATDAGPVDAFVPIDAFELDTGGSSSDYGAPPPP